LRKNIDGFSRAVIEIFNSYSWPGNIRQLANTIERAVILEEGHTIKEENVSLPTPVGLPKTESKPPTTQPLQAHEKEAVLNALEESLWIQKDAAQLLGISPRALNYKIKRLGITHPRWRKNK
jgi:DNA-binding NtrC family response regulator